MPKTTVHFDRELRHLDPDDAAAWRVWLTRHRAQWPGHHLPLGAGPQRADAKEASPSDGGAVEQSSSWRARSRRTVCFSDSVLPVPGGHEITPDLS